jgi:hypothetical protein
MKQNEGSSLLGYNAAKFVEGQPTLQALFALCFMPISFWASSSTLNMELHIPPKRPLTFSGLYGVVYQNTELAIVTNGRTSNSTYTIEMFSNVFVNCTVTTEFLSVIRLKYIVACRPVAGQRPRGKQIYNSHYWVTASQTSMLLWQQLN